MGECLNTENCSEGQETTQSCLNTHSLSRRQEEERWEVKPRGGTDPKHYESRRDTCELCHYSDHCINSTLSLS